MAFTNNPYCTLQQVKDALGVTDPNGTDTAWLNDSIVRAQALLDEKISYSFQSDGTVQTPTTRTYDGTDISYMLIDDILSLVSVVESIPVSTILNGSYVQGTPMTTNITQDIKLYPYNTYDPQWQMRRKSLNPFSSGATYTVTGIFGFSTIPPEVTRACIRLVTHWYGMRNTYYGDELLEQGNVKMRYHKEIPMDVQEIIDLKKHRRFRTR